MCNKPLKIFEADNKTYSKEFKDLLDNFIEEELTKVTTNGKLDKTKAIRYILEHVEDESLPF